MQAAADPTSNASPDPPRHTQPIRTFAMRRRNQSVDRMKCSTATHAATSAAMRMSGMTAARIMGLKLPQPATF